MNEMFAQILHLTTRGIEVAGILSIVIGCLLASARFMKQGLGGDRHEAYRNFRSSLGRSILLGLEFLVAADIIATVAIEPSVESVLILGGIVLIRTFLSLSLEVEIDGKWPWQKAIHSDDRHFAGKRDKG